eukprot:363041-Chlamydomonas_euryale.AAC.2
MLSTSRKLMPTARTATSAVPGSSCFPPPSLSWCKPPIHTSSASSKRSGTRLVSAPRGRGTRRCACGTGAAAATCVTRGRHSAPGAIRLPCCTACCADCCCGGWCDGWCWCCIGCCLRAGLRTAVRIGARCACVDVAPCCRHESPSCGASRAALRSRPVSAASAHSTAAAQPPTSRPLAPAGSSA